MFVLIEAPFNHLRFQSVELGRRLQLSLYSERQVRLCASFKTERPIWHIDATGSLVKDWNEKRVLCYAMVTPSPVDKEPCLPLLEWLSNAHDAKSIRKALVNWWIDVESIIAKPAGIVSDLSWAILHALSHSFNNIPLQEQLDAQWELMSGILKKSLVVIRLCVSHYIKSIATRLSRLEKDKKVGN